MNEYTNEKQDNTKSLQGRLSSRYATLSSFSGMIDLINNPEFKELSSEQKISPVFLTHAGQVTGEVQIEPQEQFDITCAEVMSLGRENLVRKVETENEGSATIMGTSAYLLLKNAKLVPWSAQNTSFTYDTLYLFADDIIGFSIGAM